MKHSKLARLLAGVNNTTDVADDYTTADEPERAADAAEQLKLTHCRHRDISTRRACHRGSGRTLMPNGSFAVINTNKRVRQYRLLQLTGQFGCLDSLGPWMHSTTGVAAEDTPRYA